MAKSVTIVGFLLLLFDPSHGVPRPPPNYSQDNMPDTSFTCSDKVGGYYADPEAACQMFHVCVRIGENDFSDFRFLCPNNTLFDQENFICANWFDIDCEMSTKHYSKNLEIYPTEAPVAAEAEVVYQQTPAPRLTRTHEVRRQEDGGRVYEYLYYDYEPRSRFQKSHSTTTHQLSTSAENDLEGKEVAASKEKQQQEEEDYPYYYEYYYDYDYDELKQLYDVGHDADVKKSSSIEDGAS